MKNKPVKPSRYKIQYEENLGEKLRAQEIIDAVSRIVGSEDVWITAFPEDYGAYANIELSWKELEPEDRFKMRMKRYEEKLKEYEKWKEENKDNIAKHKLEKKDKSKEKLKQEEIELKKKLREVQEKLKG